MLIIIALFLILLLLIVTVIQSIFSKVQKKFIKGKLPLNLNGFYKGKAIITGPWKGKEFDLANNKGINVLKNDHRIFPFKTSQGYSVVDKNLQVLRIDYNISEEPFWVKPILDELVMVGDNLYLGRAILRLIPGFPLIVAYFSLEREK